MLRIRRTACHVIPYAARKGQALSLQGSVYEFAQNGCYLGYFCAERRGRRSLPGICEFAGGGMKPLPGAAGMSGTPSPTGVCGFAVGGGIGKVLLRGVPGRHALQLSVCPFAWGGVPDLLPWGKGASPFPAFCGCFSLTPQLAGLGLALCSYFMPFQ